VKATLIFAAVWVAGLFLLKLTLGQQPDRRNYEYFNDMEQSSAFKAQSENTFLPHGQTQQPPPAGTIPRGYLPLHFAQPAREDVPAGAALQSPLGGKKKPAPERGRFIFETYCLVCHGAGGRGDGPVARRGFPPPPSLLLPHAKNLADGQIFHIITYGFRNMPSYASQIERSDRWQVIAYIRTLQESQP